MKPGVWIKTLLVFETTKEATCLTISQKTFIIYFMEYRPSAENEHESRQPVDEFIESANEYFKDYRIELEHIDDGTANVSWFEADGDIYELKRVVYFFEPPVGVLREFLPEDTPSTYHPDYHQCDWTLMRYSPIEGSDNKFVETMITYDGFWPGNEFIFQRHVATYDPDTGKRIEREALESPDDPEDPDIHQELLHAINVLKSSGEHRSISEDHPPLPYQDEELRLQESREYLERMKGPVPPEERLSPEFRAKVAECRGLGHEILRDQPRDDLLRTKLLKISENVTMKISSKQLTADDRDFSVHPTDEHFNFVIQEKIPQQSGNILVRLEYMTIWPDEMVELTQDYAALDSAGNRFNPDDEDITVKAMLLLSGEPKKALQKRVASYEYSESQKAEQLSRVASILKAII